MTSLTAKLIKRISVAAGFVQREYGTDRYADFVSAVRRAQVEELEKFDDLPPDIQKLVVDYERAKRLVEGGPAPRRSRADIR